MTRNFVIVPDASVWEQMEGETPTLKKLNSFLTCRFIMSKEIPSDECVRAAREILALWTTAQRSQDTEGFKGACEEQLISEFATSYPFDESTRTFDKTKAEIHERSARGARESVSKILEILQEASS